MKRINHKRISDREEGEVKRRKLNDGGSSSNSSSNSSSGGVVLRRSNRIRNQQQQRRELNGVDSKAVELNGVFGKSKITAYELWREMLMFL